MYVWRRVPSNPIFLIIPRVFSYRSDRLRSGTINLMTVSDLARAVKPASYARTKAVFGWDFFFFAWASFGRSFVGNVHISMYCTVCM